MKKVIKAAIKNALCMRVGETFSDYLDRKKHSFQRKINKKHFEIQDLEETLVARGLKKGDTVIVHSAWRSFIGFSGTPLDVINTIRKIVGDNGTIIMPTFCANKEEFYYDSPSSAGYITEVFRRDHNTIRSLNNVFSMSAQGPKAKIYTKDHIKSKYYFDNKSPYKKCIEDNAKILLLGLGRKPHKISLFHCVTYDIRNKLDIYDIYHNNKRGIIQNKNNEILNVRYVDRNKGIQNNKRRFRKLFQAILDKNDYSRINLLDIYLFESKSYYNKAKEYIIKNNYNIYINK